MSTKPKTPEEAIVTEVKPWMEQAEANIRETWDSATDYDGRIADIIAAHAPDTRVETLNRAIAALVKAGKL